MTIFLVLILICAILTVASAFTPRIPLWVPVLLMCLALLLVGRVF